MLDGAAGGPILSTLLHADDTTTRPFGQRGDASDARDSEPDLALDDEAGPSDALFDYRCYS